MLRKIITKFCLICLLSIILIIPTVSAENLPESDHPYANDFEYRWPISDPDATQMRFHFEKLDLANDYSDKLIILDEYGNELLTYRSEGEPLEDIWTAWYTGNKFRIKLETDTKDTDYGFKIDKVEIRTDTGPSETSLESYHPYANDFEYRWPISDPDATQMRFHFEKLDLADDYSDKLIILDEYGNELKTYKGQSEPWEDVWTAWYTGNKFRIKLETDTEDTDYGFKIDKVGIRTDMVPSETSIESYHPYANNFEYEWTVSDPDATQMRFHFEKLDLADDYSDKLIILDEHENELKIYKGQSEPWEDVWTEWYTGNEFNIKLETDTEDTDYGFMIDKVETRGEEREDQSSEDESSTEQTSSTEVPIEFSIIKTEKSSETAPDIELNVVKDQSTSNTFVLNGSALSDNGVKSVTVNGQHVDTESWSIPLDLPIGNNTNVIVATGYDGSTTIETINIFNPSQNSSSPGSDSNPYLNEIIGGVFVVIAAAVGALLGKRKLMKKE